MLDPRSSATDLLHSTRLPDATLFGSGVFGHHPLHPPGHAGEVLRHYSKKNQDGQTTERVAFAVARAPPSGLAYPGQTPVYPHLVPMTMQPSVEGDVDEYSVSPPLPQGVDLNSKTGVISGTPTEVSDSSTFEVSARNETGVSSTPPKFGVKVMPPESLTYLGLDHVYYVGEPRVLVTLKVNTWGTDSKILATGVGEKSTHGPWHALFFWRSVFCLHKGSLDIEVCVNSLFVPLAQSARLLVVVRPSYIPHALSYAR